LEGRVGASGETTGVAVVLAVAPVFCAVEAEDDADAAVELEDTSEDDLVRPAPPAPAAAAEPAPWLWNCMICSAVSCGSSLPRRSRTATENSGGARGGACGGRCRRMPDALLVKLPPVADPDLASVGLEPPWPTPSEMLPRLCTLPASVAASLVRGGV
jgi:hypothetical protein